MHDRRRKRLEAQIKARAAEVVTQELADPRRGLITITRVDLDREMISCKIWWSVLGDDKEREENAEMLDSAAGFVQREIAAVLHTRSVPRVSFHYDESIEGAIRIDKIIRQLRDERDERDERGEDPSGP